MRRRTFVALAPTAAGLAFEPKLDRAAIVKRHSVHLQAMDPNSPLSVGNGEFAFTADVTGLQSLPDVYERTVPLCTLAQWGWHTAPLPGGFDPGPLRLEMFDTYARQVGYATSSKGQEKLFKWLRENPHRLNLARIGFRLDGRPLRAEEISGIHQTLDLWEGVLRSRFRLRGTPVSVRTRCHESRDAITVDIESPLAVSGRLTVAFEFPYGSTGMSGSDWDSPEKHTTILQTSSATWVSYRRQLDGDTYYVALSWRDGSSADSPARHLVVLKGKNLSFTCAFGNKPIDDLPAEPSPKHWPAFWSAGGAIDLSGSADPRAEELERRIVLSQYLTAIQCAGSLPPQETGLTCNSWYGKYHLEMHWWHAAHFPMWGRTALLERSLPWYEAILGVAKEKARKQGYKGARWPKMTSPDGHDSPSPVGELLIWQQPHPISLLEYCHLAWPSRDRLRRYSKLVFETADWMADFAVKRDGVYLLGPPVIPAQENHPARETWNPTYEVEYWRESLGVAQKWRERLGMKRDPKWDAVRANMAPLAAKDGVYLAHANCPQTFTERNRDHPSMLGAYGMCRGERVDRETMRRTLLRVMREWRWEDTWGWDFPMVAMTAAKLGDPETAIRALFIESPKNTWRANGHNYQRPNLPVYLPGNGGLLIAVAHMAAAWSGFLKKGWQVRHEGLRPLLA